MKLNTLVFAVIILTASYASGNAISQVNGDLQQHNNQAAISHQPQKAGLSISNIIGGLQQLNAMEWIAKIAETEQKSGNSPEPGIMLLFGSGLCGCGIIIKRRFKK